MLDQTGALAVAELVFWVPAIVLAVWVCFRHGFGRQLGWFLIVLLALARLIGASCTIAEEQLSTPNVDLIVATAITNSIGLSFLISVVIGLLNRIADGTKMTLLPSRILRLLQLVMLVGIIMSIVGGSKLASNLGQTSKGSSSSDGVTYIKAGVILFTVGYVATAVFLIAATINLKSVPERERRLVLACWLCMPFIAVRLIFSLISIFANSEIFSYYNPNIWARAFMAVAMEFIVAAIVIAAGLLTKPIPRGQVQNRGDPESSQVGSDGKYVGTGQQSYGYVSETGHTAYRQPQYQQPQYQQPQYQQR